MMMPFWCANQRTSIQRWREQHPCASVLTCASFLVTAGGLLLAGVIAPINSATRIGLASAGAFLAISTLAIELLTEGPARVLNDDTDPRRVSLIPAPSSAERPTAAQRIDNMVAYTSPAFHHTTVQNNNLRNDGNQSDRSLLDDSFGRQHSDSDGSEPRSQS